MRDAPLGESYGDPSGLAELRGEALRTLLMALLALALGALALAVLDEPTRRPEIWLVVVSLGLTTVAAHKLRVLGLTLASLFLATGLALSLLIALHLYPESQLVCLFALVAMVATVLLSIRYGAVVALLISVFMLTVRDDPTGTVYGSPLGTVLFLTWAGTLLCWLATRPTQTALNWSWQSYVQAMRKTEEARDRQGELGRLSKSLTEAYVRLEQINLELERARQAAEEARQLKAELAAAISHELRTPLNLIIGFSEMMMTARHTYSGDVLPASYRADVEAIYRNACHISNLIDDVLDLSRIEAHRMALQRERVPLAHIVDEAVATVSNLTRELGLDLVVRIRPDLPPLFVDRTRIKQILINLLNNAIRSTDRGSITVEATQREGEVVVSVADTGVGIAPEDLPHLFAEYSHVGSPPRRGRSGLGLAVSRQFAELHGGTMWAESQPGHGSTFYVSLPLHDHVVTSPFESEPDVFARVSTEAHRRTVAVLGEDAEAAKLFQRYLDGYHVVHATTPQESAAWNGGTTPHAIVLTDDRAVEGWKAAQRILPSAPRVPPVLTCSLTTSHLRAEELGVSDYLVKPITRDQLRLALSRLGIGKGPRGLLIVEDDPEMARLLARMVRSLSRRYRVRHASNGVEGLALARDRRPDAVLLDLLMPQMDGYGMLQEMRADADLSGVPVVVITARGRQEESVLATALSVSKPGGLTVAELMRCAKSALDSLLGMPPRDSAPALPAMPTA